MDRKKKVQHGSHNPDDVFVGRWASPERKAFYTLVANEAGCTITDLIDTGIVEIARQRGMIVDGKPTPQVEEAVAILGQQFREALAAKRANRRGSKK